MPSPPPPPPDSLRVRRDLHRILVQIPATWSTGTALMAKLWIAASVLIPLVGWLGGLPLIVGLLPGVVLLPITACFLWYLYQLRSTRVEVSPYTVCISRLRLLPIDPPKLRIPLQRVEAVHLRRSVPLNSPDDLSVNYPHIAVVLHGEKDPLRVLQGHQHAQVAWIATALQDAVRQSRAIENDGIGMPSEVPAGLHRLREPDSVD